MFRFFFFKQLFICRKLIPDLQTLPLVALEQTRVLGQVFIFWLFILDHVIKPFSNPKSRFYIEALPWHQMFFLFFFCTLKIKVC